LGCYDVLSKHFLAAYWENVDNPIISNATQADETFAALKSEFNARFELISKSGTRNIKDYNRKFVMRRLNPEQGHKFMPYIVIFIDEYSDLINSDRRFLEPIISEIAKKGRAVGIHMVLATNRPTADIVDNAIKTELGGKIAFKVSTAIDSRLILNTGGAEKLICEGDMLFVDKRNLLQRAQCALPSFDDIDRVCDYISKQQGYPEPYELYYRDESEEVTDNSVDMSHLDPLFDDAARLIVMEQLGSTSLVQRKFAIGYNRAGRLLDQLEKAGIVGQAHGSKPREVFVKDEYSLNRILQRYR
jgi:S-DNA-T family DNA segregation ATPase FtsK/SpoIIIE